MPPRLLIFIAALAFVVGLIQFGLIDIAFDKLGLSSRSAYLLLICTLGGSMINLPLFTLDADVDAARAMSPKLQRWPLFRPPPFTGKTLVAINVGGAVVPISFSLYLLAHSPLGLVRTTLAVVLVSLVVHLISRPIPGRGIGVPMLIAPLAAAVIATMLDPQERAPLAYIGGTLGVLIGADLMRLKDIRGLGAPIASIGGGGSFDGVFLTGLIAVLLA